MIVQKRTTAYLASYDYHHHRDYSALYDFMGRVGAVRLLQSSWLVATEATAPTLRDAMRTCGDGDETFAIVELVPGSGWATFAVPVNASGWLSANVTPADE